MSHTLPDYTTKYKLAKIFGNVDNAELAARLGACSTMDRRGNLIWYDDFEAAAAVKWTIFTDVGATAALSTDRAWMGNQSMKTVTPAVINNSASLTKIFSLPPERRMGAEFMFCITTEKPVIILGVYGYDGTSNVIGGIKYDHNLEKLYYFNSAGAFIELPLYDSLLITTEHWFYVKLVVDWDTKKYVRLIFSSTEYDLSSIDLRTIASIVKKYITVEIKNMAGTNAAATVYFDNFILTQNEP